MGEPTRKGGCPPDGRAATLGELIHEAVHRAIELAVEEELTAALGAARYGRDVARGGYRNGRRARTLTGPTGPLALTLPRATLFAASGTREWTDAPRVVPRGRHGLGDHAPDATRPGGLGQVGGAGGEGRGLAKIASRAVRWGDGITWEDSLEQLRQRFPKDYHIVSPGDLQDVARKLGGITAGQGRVVQLPGE